ncbi:MAG TPA: uracil-DNA glycosylase family protein, partial [Spirochaetia bacterium]|nr:uracil-DNA glycosylase family protein [Spirochaetia bacterium]
MKASARIDALVRASRRLAAGCDRITFHEPVSFVYNPLRYARRFHEEYIRRFAGSEKRAVFLGMNPGPWGMAQTGVPFGEVAAVRDWMGISGTVHAPTAAHPRVKIAGFDCHRSEVSGHRLWGLIRDRYVSPNDFFREHLVVNYCPLLFLDPAGRNLTPDKINPQDRRALLLECDDHLRAVIEALAPRWLVGIGKFAQSRLEALQESMEGE